VALADLHSGAMVDTPRLGAQLERLTLRALADAWDDTNATFFKRALRRPVLALSDTSQRLGRWVSAERTLEISRRVLSEQSWGVVLEVLKHEMAHQFVDEVLGQRSEAAHGPAFRQVCEERAIDARAEGIPSTKPRRRWRQRSA
jgi:predicted SprT family Zn-dependent metalloprotease